MAPWTYSLFFVGAALAHTGMKAVVIDGTTYPPFNARIDSVLGAVRRIGWSHDVGTIVFTPVTNVSNPALACQPNPRAPLLKAPARAGAEVTFKYTPIIRMHQGPIMTYMGYLPTPDTHPNNVKFFKIYEKGFDVTKDRWANEVAADNNNTYSVKIPSDIKPGIYILRTELLALHGNIPALSANGLSGPQLYPYCFNVEVLGSGSISPEGVKIPGVYQANDFGIKFGPYMGIGSGVGHNSKYIPPGPPVYKGKYDAPVGQRPAVKETGSYTGEVAVKYKELVDKLETSGVKIPDFVNGAWPHNIPVSATIFKDFPDVVKNTSMERLQILSDIESFKKLAAAQQSQAAKRFVA